MFLEELKRSLEGKEAEVIAASWRRSFCLCYWFLLKSSFDREEHKFLSVKQARLGRIRSRGVPISSKEYQKILIYALFSYITSHSQSNCSVKYTFHLPSIFPRDLEYMWIIPKAPCHWHHHSLVCSPFKWEGASGSSGESSHKCLFISSILS